MWRGPSPVGRRVNRAVPDDGAEREEKKMMEPKSPRFPEGLDRRRRRALERLRACRGVVVALSGGVDSAALLCLALEALGHERVLAATGRSPSLAPEELDDARRVARRLGARHEVVETREIDLPAYRANRGDRCYHCRTELFRLLTSLAAERGLERVALGAIADDATDFRPGMRAARESRVVAPLLEAGIGKEDVRAIAAEAGLEVHDKPAAACLASRIPPGTEVTAARLAQVEAAESALRDLGFRGFRVRHHGQVARVELRRADLARLADPDLRKEMAEAVKAAGFRFVAADLEGYRTGSLNPDGGPDPRSDGAG
jgi:uncharacterized protein